MQRLAQIHFRQFHFESNVRYEVCQGDKTSAVTQPHSVWSSPSCLILRGNLHDVLVACGWLVLFCLDFNSARPILVWILSCVAAQSAGGVAKLPLHSCKTACGCDLVRAPLGMLRLGIPMGFPLAWRLLWCATAAVVEAMALFRCGSSACVKLFEVCVTLRLIFPKSGLRLLESSSFLLSLLSQVESESFGSHHCFVLLCYPLPKPLAELASKTQPRDVLLLNFSPDIF
jgi:hypothetical protein